MNQESDRDSALARQIGPALRETQGPGGEDCPDAGELAAFYERTLSTAETASAERHIADCGRCQAQLAAIARSEPSAVPSRSKWGWLVGSRALVPLATAALAVVTLSIVTFDMLELRNAGSVASPSPVIRPEASVAEERKPAAESSDRYALADQPAAVPVSPPAPARTPPAIERSLALAKTDADEKDKKERGRLAPPVAVPDRLDRLNKLTAPRQERSADESAAVPAPPPPASAAAAPMSETQQTDLAKTAEAESRTNEQLARQTTAAYSPRLQAQPIVVRTPAPKVWLRLGPGLAIWRSDDAGVSWNPEVNDLPSEPLAAAAPSADVIWVVGRQGLIRVSDKRKWRMVGAPAHDDLVRVEAQDDRRATIFTADGKAFTTTNAGASWIAQPQQ